jgi:hypothetical protein
MQKTLQERFQEKVNTNGPTMPGMSTPCHIWTGALKTGKYGGYGTIFAHGRYKMASHVALWLATGQWPKECALHHCDNPPCVRGDHLYEGSKQDNARDRERRQRGNHATGDQHGCATHPGLRSGEKNGRAKLSEADVVTLRNAYAAGGIVAELSVAFGITDVAIYDIVHGKLWPNVGGPIIPSTGDRWYIRRLRLAARQRAAV